MAWNHGSSPRRWGFRRTRCQQPWRRRLGCGPFQGPSSTRTGIALKERWTEPLQTSAVMARGMTCARHATKTAFRQQVFVVYQDFRILLQMYAKLCWQNTGTDPSGIIFISKIVCHWDFLFCLPNRLSCGGVLVSTEEFTLGQCGDSKVIQYQSTMDKTAHCQ